jgi:putative peptidoglycan lipid II flippase
MTTSAPEPLEPAQAVSDAERERRALGRRAGLVGLGTLVSRVLGLVREMVLAGVFRRDETDAFFAAFRIPNALRQLLGEGAVSSAVVPILSSKLEKEGETAAREFFAKVRGLSLVILLLVTVVGVGAAPWLTLLFAEGFRQVPGQFERTSALTRLVFPYIFFMGTAALGMAALNAKREFFVAAVAPALLNVAIVACCIGFPGWLAEHGIDRVHALGVGALLGGLLQMVAQWPALRRLGYLDRPRFSWEDRDVREVFRRMGPMLFGLGVYYVDLVLSTRFLAELGTGAQSYFNYASRICDFPQGVFVLALSTAQLPALATLAAKNDREELVKTYAHGMRYALFVAIPASVLMVTLAEPVVAALFQRGHFDGQAARETARSLVWQGGAIWTVAAVRQIVPVFHAMGDTRTPVIVSTVDLVAFVVIAQVATVRFGHAGVSMAVAGSSFVQMALLVFALRHKVGTFAAGTLAGSVLRTTAASAVAGIGAFGAARLASGVSLPMALRGPVLAALGTLVFGVLFVAMAWGARSPELGVVGQGIARRLARGRR